MLLLIFRSSAFTFSALNLSFDLLLLLFVSILLSFLSFPFSSSLLSLTFWLCDVLSYFSRSYFFLLLERLLLYLSFRSLGSYLPCLSDFVLFFSDFFYLEDLLLSSRSFDFLSRSFDFLYLLFSLLLSRLLPLLLLSFSFSLPLVSLSFLSSLFLFLLSCFFYFLSFKDWPLDFFLLRLPLELELDSEESSDESLSLEESSESDSDWLESV